ncbi:LysR family transcriptional regulator [Anaeropeptidivorans aminofermentans]|uniref:LysR family transcriptional regulator n=1 Tax=Anaeropeptidivorans aminofermentans TaxID=2934315 RepID=UPI002025B341|nr:LysR family transcriptional regulator [Anaeropeptidivorans aminofermentans]
MDEIKLKYFISAARHLSFTKAAEDCHVTQSTISKQISALEEELNSHLFYRLHNSLKLTAAGERLATRAEDYMEQYRMINESVRRLHLEQEQRLTIGIGPWEWALVSKPLELFAERYPDVEVFCSHYTYKRLVSHLRSGTVDIGICSESCVGLISEIYSEPLGFSKFEVAAHKDHLFFNLSSEDQAVLKDQIVITFYENEYEPVRPYCIKNNMAHSNFTHSNFFPSFIAMVRAKVCIALMPVFTKSFLASDIRFIDVLQKPLVQKFYAARNSSVLSHAAKNFMDICKEVYPDLPEIGFS